ncbi:MAG TPA: DUF1992 domain-containing protein [Actinobacteria bacterium]|nr:DUF1992 domain-containing protein [Actinomycetota bacterium]
MGYLFVERLLEEARDRGDFDALPGSGEPLELADTGPGWWARRTLQEERRHERRAELLRRLRRELPRLVARRDRAGLEALAAAVRAWNDGAADDELPTVDVDELLRRAEERC